MADNTGLTGTDQLGATALREQVLRTWGESPARFREDANAEEDAALAGYRDRLLVELLQNAADAATAAGSPGRVLIRLIDGALCCANTGATLTPEGLQALCTLRASAKRGVEGAVGRFGTGFCAVLPVTDEPLIVSGGAAVRWSRERTRELIATLPALATELALRDGEVPVLRLPFAVAAPPPPDGYDTEVRLPLLPGVDAEALLRDFDPAILLLLQGISELTIQGAGVRRHHTVERTGDTGATSAGPTSADTTSTVTLDGLRWLAVHASAALPAELAATGAVERRGLARLTATALWPEGGWPPAVPAVLHAPTPTDERLTLPVLVSADVPLEAQRRRSVPGPLRRAALAVAADAVVTLARRLSGPEMLRLVPTGLPAGDVDAALCELVLERLRADPPVPGRHTLDLGMATAAVLALLTDPHDPVVADLLPASWPARSDALRLLGIDAWGTAEVVEVLADAGQGRPASWWRSAYLALTGAPDRDALASLPVPLAGGGYAPGPRGLLVLPDGDALPDGLPDRLRVADPAAVAPLLLSLGAVEAGPVALLEALRPEIEASYDEGDTALAAPVLALAGAAGLLPGELPWLADLALSDADGELAPAGELVLAGSTLDLALTADAPLGVLGPEWSDIPREVLLAVGVADGLVVVRGEDAVAGLDGGEEFLVASGDTEELAGVRDLEWLRWPEGLQLLGNLSAETHEYVRWWCATVPVFGGLLPSEVLAPDADPLLTGLFDPSPQDLPPGVAELVGCRRSLPTEDDEVLDLLDRLGDETRSVGRAQLRGLLIHTAAHAPAGMPPLAVRAVGSDGSLGCVPGSRAVLVDAPDLLPLLGSRPVVPAPAGLAQLLSGILGVPVASSLSTYPVVSTHPLIVTDLDGVDRQVSWRITPDGVVHSAGPEGLGRALAWQAGRWSERHAYVARLRAADDPRLAALEDDLSESG